MRAMFRRVEPVLGENTTGRMQFSARLLECSLGPIKILRQKFISPT